MKELVKKNDAKELEMVSHKIKGSAANLGAKGFAKSCYKIEKKARLNNLHNMDINFQELNHVYVKTIEEYKNFLLSINKQLII